MKLRTLLLSACLAVLANSDCSTLSSPPARKDICKDCRELPRHLLECDPVYDLSERNKTFQDEFIEKNGYGCRTMGGEAFHEVEETHVVCKSLDTFTCYYNKDATGQPDTNTTPTWQAERKFLSAFSEPCIRYSGHYFQTTLIFSILLGFLGVDRFCLGWTGIGVGKMLTIGGLGIWWIIDIILLITGNLTPNDRSNWETLY